MGRKLLDCVSALWIFIFDFDLVHIFVGWGFTAIKHCGGLKNIIESIKIFELVNKRSMGIENKISREQKRVK